MCAVIMRSVTSLSLSLSPFGVSSIYETCKQMDATDVARGALIPWVAW